MASRACCTPYEASATSCEIDESHRRHPTAAFNRDATADPPPDEDLAGGVTASMSFRRRITLVSAAAVAVAVVLASVLTYLLAAHQLYSQVDGQLRERAQPLVGRFDHTPRPLARLGSRHRPFGGVPPGPEQVRGYQQINDASGKILFRSSTNLTLPVDAAARALAAKEGKPFFRDVHANDIHLRILAESLPHAYAVQLAQPLTDVDNVLRRLRLILALLDIGGIALAALLGRLVAGAVVAPVKRLTEATEHVTRTQDLSERIEPVGEDEIGRLAESFNAMLDALQSSIGALDASVDAQRQLVADASHELRTPVTSLRTNIEILKQERDMGVEERQRMLDDVVEQIEELTLLMNDLIELARGEQPRPGNEDVRLDLVVEEAIDRARRHSPDTPFHVELEPVVLTGAPGRLGRAVNNLIDNAINYSPHGSPIEIALHGKELSVRDHGAGISSADLPHVFDRFYRGVEARGQPGSGLGLAIVRQVAEQHSGTVSAQAARGGGTVMRLRLPGGGPVESLSTLDPTLHAAP
jgi:two-component system sensor histidine kinase MprB